MTVVEKLTGADLAAWMRTYRDALHDHAEALNRLNVYPVPDGDTGKNMSSTLDVVVKDLDGTDGADMESVCQAISHGSLMGAAGNSGVILSQILRGLTGAARSAADLDAAGVATALRAATDSAYKAVGNPVEGTILTVLRESAEAIEGTTASLLDTLQKARTAAAESLERTPELLPKLAQAGVVDAGGAGYLLLLDAALTVIDGRPLPEPDVPAKTAAELVHGSDADQHGDDRPDAHDHGHGDGLDELRYEVMYFLEAPDEAIDAFKEVWATVGDSIVVVGGDGLWNCHIHTNDIGAAVEAAIECGRPRQIRVTDLHEQVEEERWVREAEVEPVIDPAAEPCDTAVVVVCEGSGQSRLFRSLRVQGIVVGGQTQNPTTATLLEAVDGCPAPAVIVLPNNGNIVAVADQLDALTDKDVKVLPTRSVPEGLTALLEYDPYSPVDVNLERMAEMAESVIAGEVTQAVRDTSSEVGDVKTGDWIGLTRAGVRAIGASPGEATIGLLADVIGDEHGLVTILEGDGATAGDTRSITEWMGENHPLVSVEVQEGGQAHYPYLLGIE